LKSNRRRTRKKENEDHLQVNPDTPDLVSCKSIFRLADKVCSLSLVTAKTRFVHNFKIGIRELEDLALENLHCQLTPEIAGIELFSRYCSRYYSRMPLALDLPSGYRHERVKAMLTEYVIQNWTKISKTQGYKVQVEAIVIVRGESAEGGQILMDLLAQMPGKEPSKGT